MIAKSLLCFLSVSLPGQLPAHCGLNKDQIHSRVEVETTSEGGVFACFTLWGLDKRCYLRRGEVAYPASSGANPKRGGGQAGPLTPIVPFS